MKYLFFAVVLIGLLGGTRARALDDCPGGIDQIQGECSAAYFTGGVPPPSACDSDCYPSTTCAPQCNDLTWTNGGCTYEPGSELLCSQWWAEMPKSFCRACTCEVLEPEVWRCAAFGTGYRHGKVCVQVCSNS